MVDGFGEHHFDLRCGSTDISVVIVDNIDFHKIRSGLGHTGRLSLIDQGWNSTLIDQIPAVCDEEPFLKRDVQREFCRVAFIGCSRVHDDV